MKKRIFSILVLLLSILISGYSQKCEVENDQITGEKVCKFINQQKTLRFEYKGGPTVDFYTTFIYAGEQNTVIPAGSEVIFKLVNGTIVKLQSIADAKPQTRVSNTQTTVTVTSLYTFAFKLTQEELQSLASAKIDMIRYPSVDGGQIDYDVKGLGKIFANKITNGAECILSNVNSFVQ